MVTHHHQEDAAKKMKQTGREEEEEEDLGSRSLKKIEPGEEHFQTGRINVPSGRR